MRRSSPHPAIGQSAAPVHHILSIVRGLIELLAKALVGFGFAFAEQPQTIQQLFRRKIIADSRAILPNINHVEWMQTVLLIHIDLIVDVFQNKDHTRRCIGRRDTTIHFNDTLIRSENQSLLRQKSSAGTKQIKSFEFGLQIRYNEFTNAKD